MKTRLNLPIATHAALLLLGFSTVNPTPRQNAMKAGQRAKTWLVILLFGIISASISTAFAQGTAFTYQGRLADNSALPNGTYDMRFRLYDVAPLGTGTILGEFVAVPVPVANGLLTTNVDFGGGPFAGGSPRYLEIGVRTNGNLGAYTVLGPRQQLTPTPYAIRAGEAGNAGTLGGQASSAFAPASGSTAYVAKAGDTMTGALSIVRDGADQLYVERTGAIVGRYRLGIAGANNNFYIQDEVVGGGTPRLVINGSGNVGIGTTAPTGTLHVASAGAAQLFIERTGAISGKYRLGVAGANNTFSIQDEVAQAQRLVINGDGNVGIGTTAPSSPLHIRTSANLPLLQLSQDNGNYWCGFDMGNSAGAHWSMNVHDGATPALAFWAGGNYAFGCDWSGTFSVKVLQINGADVAEPFHMTTKDLPKGSVVVIDEENPGQLRLSDRAYDQRVAGILSGANGVNSGILLKQQGFNDGGENVALSGRVYAQADASYGAIKPGDLLTTSDTPGHCMKVSDPARAQGAIIGKAMSALNEGKGMVLVLVSLQ